MGGSGVAVGCSGVGEAGSGVAVAGSGVAVGGAVVGLGGSGVAVKVGCRVGRGVGDGWGCCRPPRLHPARSRANSRAGRKRRRRIGGAITGWILSEGVVDWEGKAV